ncbi:MAG: 16S rRNA (guanine(527)-N(7))-methyltransferase RsmG [Firmicutes bacterium]|nr:16S rRNA (guanine(527)-N(7))-methyltransferase RsmG [Bacillota bacterium]
MPDFRETIVSGARDLGINLDSDKVEMFCTYRDLLMRWNTVMNLTSIRDDQGMAVKHFLDSLTCLLVVPPGGASSLADVGTGAGFPGLVLKIAWPSARVLLLDSVGKKLKFVSEVARVLGLNDVEVVQGRAEEIARMSWARERYDLGVARGVADLAVVSEYCMPFIACGGVFVAMKGPRVEEELRSGARAIAVLGGGEPSMRRVHLPFGAGERVLVSARKVKPTPSEYPRKTGLPERRPLFGEAGQNRS